MPYVRLYPNATVSNDIPSSGMSGGGSIPAHTILSDLSYFTYMRQVHSGIGTLTRLSMGTYTLQANERIVAMRIGMVRAHTHPLGVYAQLNGHVNMGAGTWARVIFPDITKPKYVPVYYGPWIYKNAADGSDWDQTELNALELYVRWLNPGGTFDARLYEIWVDVWIRAQPVPIAVWPSLGSVVYTDKTALAWAIPFDDGIPYQQDQYELKIFTKAVVEGGGFDPDTSVAYTTVPVWGTSKFASGPFIKHPRLDNDPLVWGDEYYWTVKSRTKMPGNNPPFTSEWSDPTIFKVTSKPSANILTPTGVTTTNLPVITWENSDPEGDVQQAYEIRVYERPGASWVGFDPDTTVTVPIWKTTGTDRTTFEAQMLNPVRDNKVYRTYMKTAQKTFESITWDPTSDPYFKVMPGPLLWGDWTFEDFTTDFVEPNPPTLNITEMADMSNRIQMVPGVEPVDIDYYVLERSLDLGVTWETFRLGDGELTTADLDDLTSAFFVFDHEVPLFTEVRYRGYSVSTDLGPGFEMASAYSNIVTATLESNDLWIKDTGDSDNNGHFPYADEYLQRTTKRTRGIYTPLGRSKQIVVRGQADSDSFVLNLTIIGSTLKNKLDNLIRGNRTLFITCPKGTWYMDISGDVNWMDRLGDRRQGEDDAYRVSIPLIEVDGTDV